MNTLSNPLNPTRVRCMCDKHQVFEEPCESKDSRTVLKTSAGGDTCTEFNQRKLKNKKKGSLRGLRIQKQVGLLHEKIRNCRKDFFFKTAHHLCNQAGMIFAEDLNLKALGRSALRKACLDASWGSFLNILSFVCWERGVYFAKVDANGTSQICPNCGVNCGKKDLSQRIHHCDSCGYQADRDVAAAQVVKERGLSSVGQARIMLIEGKEIGAGVYARS